MTVASLQLQAELAEMPRLVGWVAEQAEALGLTGRQRYAIELCLEEVVANLVMHGRPSGCSPIAITIRLETAPLRLTVEDDAIPFDATAPLALAQPQTLAEASPGGLGLRLVQGFSAWRDYAREEGRNRLTLGFA